MKGIVFWGIVAIVSYWVLAVGLPLVAMKEVDYRTLFWSAIWWGTCCLIVALSAAALIARQK